MGTEGRAPPKNNRKKGGLQGLEWVFFEVLLVWLFNPPLRRFEHDFSPGAGLTLSDPARRLLRAGSWVSLRRKIARMATALAEVPRGSGPAGPVSFADFSLRVQRKVSRVQGGALGRGGRGWSPHALE
jgi:hypothetical protein